MEHPPTPLISSGVLLIALEFLVEKCLRKIDFFENKLVFDYTFGQPFCMFHFEDTDFFLILRFLDEGPEGVRGSSVTSGSMVSNFWGIDQIESRMFTPLTRP